MGGSSFAIVDKTPFKVRNTRRLLQVDTIERLSLPSFNSELSLLPFAANVDYLDYDISFAALLEADVPTLNIGANKLALTLCFGTFPTELICSFLRRVAELRHLVDFRFGLDPYYFTDSKVDVPACVAEELGRAALANRHLKVFDLCAYAKYMNWGAHVRTLFHYFREHQSLCTLKVHVDNSTFGSDFCHLRELICHNRNITVTDEDGTVHSDGSLMETIYSLNRFYRGSARLAVQSPFDRPLLVATALMKSASNDFQRSGLLLSYHVDAVCELAQLARLDELCGDDDSCSVPVLESNDRKRRRTMQ